MDKPDKNAAKSNDSTQVGTFWWNELNTNDLPSAEKFYTKLFDWGTDFYSGGGETCTLFKVGQKLVGGMVKNPHPDPKSPPMWLSYVRVADVDASIAKATQLGGKVLIPPTDILNVGRIAVFADPQGAALGLYRPLSA